MNLRTLLAFSLLATPLAAQQLTTADSNLVYAILTAEDRRDSMAPALAEGMRHADERIRMIATRAKGRITDSLFAGRSALPAPAPRLTWPLPAWRLRYDTLRQQRDDCATLRTAMADSVVQVRLRAYDLLRASCANDEELQALVASRVLFATPSAAVRSAPRSWHETAHALVALARVWPGGAGKSVREAAGSPTWQLRMYAARAAQLTADTGLLLLLARNLDGNVAEAAIGGLSGLGGHAHDDAYLRALASDRPQAVRAAAMALKGSPHPKVRPAAERALRTLGRHHRDSERDARLALLDLLGRPATADIAWNRPRPLPRAAVALALGRVDTLRVLLQNGRSFLVRLRGDIAPITAARVLTLVHHGDYRGGSWHRVIPDFVVQGGLAGANEYVGGSHFFRDELGNVSHLRGGVGMSTRGHDTGDGQWFIDLSDLSRLDRDYTLFGEVIQGMDVVDGVLEGESIRSITRMPRTR